MRISNLRVLFFTVAVAGLFGCVNDLAEVNRMFNDNASRTEIALDVEILYSDSAIVRVRVLSPKLVRHLEGTLPTDKFPEGIHVDFLDEDGEISSVLDAHSGERISRENKMIARDSVVLQNNIGEKLETSELIWDEKTAIVYTDKFVKITKPDEIIFSYGFRAKQDFSEYELLSVVARMKVDEFSEDLKN
ncbi:MAG: LPS export ABC transporter periplasmic protein LptC [Saprospiraceae bacterium]|nr:LPS export ABC transporter periplasmic protein LptC [Saprospiraceae bacterium]